MIEQITKMLAKVLLLKEQGKTQEAADELDNAFLNAVGIDPVLLDTLSVTDAALLLGMSHDPATASIKCLQVARLLKEKAALFAQSDAVTAKEHSQKALSFYREGLQHIGYTEVDMSEYRTEAKELADTLAKPRPDSISTI